MSRRKSEEFNITRDKRAIPGKTLARGYLSHYYSKGLESTSDKLVAIWFKIGPYSSVSIQVTKAIASSNSTGLAV